MGKKRARKNKNKTVIKSTTEENDGRKKEHNNSSNIRHNSTTISASASLMPSTSETTSSIFSSLFADSSIGGGSATSANTSIFSNSNSNNIAMDLFSSSKANELQKVSKKRMRKNEKLSSDLNCNEKVSLMKKGVGSGHDEKITVTTQTIIDNRKKRTSSKASIDAIDSITVSLPSSMDDDNDDDEIQNGIMRLFTNQSDAVMRKKGVLIIKSLDNKVDIGGGSSSRKKNNVQLFDKILLDSMSEQAKEIERDVCLRLEEEGKIWQIIEDGNEKARDANDKSEDNMLCSSTSTSHHKVQLEKDHAFQYHEVASRCLGRLDIRHGMDKAPFSTEDVISNPYLMSIIRSLLGKGAKLVYAGLILSFPKSADQPWHQDGSALFDESDGFSSDMHLPPYALNIFVPLDDVNEEIGPTEFYPGSHFGSVARNIIQGEGGSVQGEEGVTTIGPLLNRGDALIYDYRICHRGTSNLSERKTRPMLYLMYARPWFYEHLNFGKSRLFPS